MSDSANPSAIGQPERESPFRKSSLSKNLAEGEEPAPVPRNRATGHKGSEFLDELPKRIKHRYSEHHDLERCLSFDPRRSFAKPRVIPAFVFGICGPITAGKNHISKYIAKRFLHSNVRIHTINEMMFLDTSQKDSNLFPRFCYEAYDWKLMAATVAKIKQGTPTEFSVYHSKSRLLERKKRFINYCDVLIVEGSYFMNIEAVRSLCDFKLYLDTDFDIVLSRFIYKFHKKEDFAKLLKGYLNEIKPSYEKYMVNQGKVHADAIMSNFDGAETRFENLKKTPMFKMLESYVETLSTRHSLKDNEQTPNSKDDLNKVNYRKF